MIGRIDPVSTQPEHPDQGTTGSHPYLPLSYMYSISCIIFFLLIGTWIAGKSVFMTECLFEIFNLSPKLFCLGSLNNQPPVPCSVFYISDKINNVFIWSTLTTFDQLCTYSRCNLEQAVLNNWTNVLPTDLFANLQSQSDFVLLSAMWLTKKKLVMQRC